MRNEAQDTVAAKAPLFVETKQNINCLFIRHKTTTLQNLVRTVYMNEILRVVVLWRVYKQLM
jgi:hypothetical protein